jgi:hypothetical protein
VLPCLFFVPTHLPTIYLLICTPHSSSPLVLATSKFLEILVDTCCITCNLHFILGILLLVSRPIPTYVAYCRDASQESSHYQESRLVPIHDSRKSRTHTKCMLRYLATETTSICDIRNTVYAYLYYGGRGLPSFLPCLRAPLSLLGHFHS